MLFLRIIILLIFPVIFSCAGGNSPLWQAHIFNGTDFSSTTDSTSPVIWLRSGYLPAIAAANSGALPSGKLPAGSGAVAGVCYQQTAGGKINGHNSFTPYPDEQVTFKSKSDGVSVARTDKDGLFAEYLPTGEYELICRGVRAEFTIKNGETTLVPIRGGKRMVD